MKRLTEKDESPCTCCGGIGHCSTDCSYKQIYDRLAEYEDIGLEPEKIVFLKNVVDDAFSAKPEFTEHIRELLRAEKGGRLVVLPCKIGATVYRFQRYFDDATLTSKIKIKPCEVESVSIEGLMTTDHVFLLFSDFGKTVFLTREEAEKALEDA